MSARPSNLDPKIADRLNHDPNGLVPADVLDAVVGERPEQSA